MEKYRQVEEHKGSGDEFLEGSSASEVRITQQGKPRNYITYAMNLFVTTSHFLHNLATAQQEHKHYMLYWYLASVIGSSIGSSQGHFFNGTLQLGGATPPKMDVYIALHCGTLAKNFKGDVDAPPYINETNLNVSDIQYWFQSVRSANSVTVQLFDDVAIDAVYEEVFVGVLTGSWDSWWISSWEHRWRLFYACFSWDMPHSKCLSVIIIVCPTMHTPTVEKIITSFIPWTYQLIALETTPLNRMLLWMNHASLIHIRIRCIWWIERELTCFSTAQDPFS